MSVWILVCLVVVWLLLWLAKAAVIRSRRAMLRRIATRLALTEVEFVAFTKACAEFSRSFGGYPVDTQAMLVAIAVSRLGPEFCFRFSSDAVDPQIAAMHLGQSLEKVVLGTGLPSDLTGLPPAQVIPAVLRELDREVEARKTRARR